MPTLNCLYVSIFIFRGWSWDTFVFVQRKICDHLDHICKFWVPMMPGPGCFMSCNSNYLWGVITLLRQGQWVSGSVSSRSLHLSYLDSLPDGIIGICEMGLNTVASQLNTQQMKSYLTFDYAILFCVAQLYGAVLITLLYGSCDTVSLPLSCQSLPMPRYIWGETDTGISPQ